MKDNEQTYLSRIGLMKPRYQQRSSRLRDYNRAMKTMEERTGVKMTKPAKEVKAKEGQAVNKTQQRLKTRRILSEAFGKR